MDIIFHYGTKKICKQVMCAQKLALSATFIPFYYHERHFNKIRQINSLSITAFRYLNAIHYS
jgi:hypothetical protein